MICEIPRPWQVAAILAIILLDYPDFVLILALLIMNATISYREEASADKVLAHRPLCRLLTSLGRITTQQQLPCSCISSQSSHQAQSAPIGCRAPIDCRARLRRENPKLHTHSAYFCRLRTTKATAEHTAPGDNRYDLLFCKYCNMRNGCAQAIKALTAALAPKARAVRNGELQQLDASQLVPGDIILMAIGNIVPADVKLLGEEGDDIPMQV